MRNRIRENCRKPKGFFGLLSIRKMNQHHKELSLWGMEKVNWEERKNILEIGCGGGVNIHRMLKQYPAAIIDGIDYSSTAVKSSKKENKKYLEKRCHILQADVMNLPMKEESYDAVVGIETIYFWPDLLGGLKEIYRVLKTGGQLLIIVEMSDPLACQSLCEECPGLRVYSADEIQEKLQLAGFDSVSISKKEQWLSIVADKK